MPNVKAVSLVKQPFQNYKTPTLKKAITALQRAVKKMNDGGKHWIQHSYRHTIISDGKRVVAHCAVGGVEAVTKPEADERDAAVLALALAASKKQTNKQLAQLLKDLAEWELDQVEGWDFDPSPCLKDYFYADRRGEIEQIVTLYNDAGGRTWKQIVKLFEKAQGIIETEISGRQK